MTKVLYIVGLVCCAALFVSMIYFLEEDRDARWDYYDSYDSFYDYDEDSYGDYDYGGYDYEPYDRRGEISTIAGLFGVLFCIYYIVTYIIGLVKVKRTVATVFNIIGISLAGIFLLVNAINILDANQFDDWGPSWLLLIMFMIPCCIVGLVQAVKYDKILKYGPNYGRPKVRYGQYQPSYNPNHPSASGNVIPGVPPPAGHGHPAQDPAAAQRMSQQTPPPAQPQQPIVQPGAGGYTRQTDTPQQTPASQPQQPTQPQTPPPSTGESLATPSRGVEAPKPVPPVSPVPPVGPIDNDPIITDEDADEDLSSIDDL